MPEVNKAFEEFAKQFGKQDSEEMRMYFKAGWIAGLDKALETMRNLDFKERFDDTKDL